MPHSPRLLATERLPGDLRKTALAPDFWYPLARSRDLVRGKARAVAFAGEPIVLVRGKDNQVFALEDRCAHRQVPLSRGMVDESGLRCGYHGWTYDAQGHCVGVPYLHECTQRPTGVRAYPCREVHGLVFVFTGAPEKAAEAAFPEISAAGDKAYKTRYLDREVACHWSFMHENLMDMNHQFLHRRLMGGIRTTFLGMRQGPDWCETDYTFRRASGKQPLGEKFIIGFRPEAAPEARDVLTIRTGYPYQTLEFRTAGSKHPALSLWNAYVPVDREQRRNHTLGLMMIRRPAFPGLLEVLWPFIVWFTNGIFAEDREICELEQAAFEAQGEDRNQEIFPAIRALRRVLLENSPLLDR
jgi:phenylpropionate dioxygenase-like ring-hydroxylating dioxygenase large terminal subunit